jgi:HEPN domain-containing protein
LTQSDAWFVQAASDYESAQRLLDREDPATYCQVIAKCQQTVEKGVKSVVAALIEANELTLQIGYKHEAERFVSTLLRSSRKWDKGIQAEIEAWLAERWRGEIRAVDALVPKRPPPGQRPARNTEYPFQDPDGSWHAPAAVGVFDIKDVERFLRLARHVYVGAAKIRSAIKRMYPPTEVHTGT